MQLFLTESTAPPKYLWMAPGGPPAACQGSSVPSVPCERMLGCSPTSLPGLSYPVGPPGVEEREGSILFFEDILKIFISCPEKWEMPEKYEAEVVHFY